MKVVHDPEGSYGGLVGFKGLSQKIQQTATKDSTNGHKRLNKETQKTQQKPQFEMEGNEGKKGFTKDSTKSTKDSTKRHKTQQRAQKTQQKETKDSTKRHKRLNK